MNPFIAEHIIAAPEDCSLLYVKNGKTVLSVNEDVRRPLASIYKLIVLLAYLDQCEQGKVHPDDKVHYNELRRLWIRWIDPAFAEWYRSLDEERKIKKYQIALKEVVIGMLQYSCNTNTDYLLAKFGFNKVDEQLEKHQIEAHDIAVPISTSVLASLEKSGTQQTPESLGEIARDYFMKMMNGEQIEGVDLNLLNDFNSEAQCAWSDLLPHASVRTYGSILKRFQAMHQQSKELQGVMHWYDKLKSYEGFIGGMKLGHTPKVFNVAMYSKDSQGNEYELVYFLNNLTIDQRFGAQAAFNEFNLKLLKDDSFVDQFKKQLSDVYAG